MAKNCRIGTVRFWFCPNWSSVYPFLGAGPGGWARLIEMGNTTSATAGWWALSVDPTGANLIFESQINGAGNRTTYFTRPIEWQAGRWQHIAITYTGTASKLYINGVLFASGAGIQGYPTAAVRAADGLNIGSNRSGNEQARGRFDELETFNYALTPEAIAADYQAVSTVDSDQEGLTDIRENEQGSNPLLPDTDGDGLTDAQEVDVYFSSPLEIDTDYDGRSDWQEAMVDLTVPNNPSSVVKTMLASFSFNGVSLKGSQGQAPKAVQNIQLVNNWGGTALKVAGPAPANLKYSELEFDGSANINCREGTIQFWFKPNWSSGTGPGHVARLIEVGDPNNPAGGWWALSVNAAGNRVRFEGLTNGLAQPRVFFDEDAEAAW